MKSHSHKPAPPCKELLSPLPASPSSASIVQYARPTHFGRLHLYYCFISSFLIHLVRSCIIETPLDFQPVTSTAVVFSGQPTMHPAKDQTILAKAYGDLHSQNEEC